MSVSNQFTVSLGAAVLGFAVTLPGCSSAPLDAPAPAAAEPTAGDEPSSGGGSASAPGTDYTRRDYPSGPYGSGVGATLEDVALLGWRDPVAAGYDISKFEAVRLADFYNPDGRSDVKLIWINASAVWCSVCRAEMTDMRDKGVHAALGPKGVQMIVTLFEDNKSGPAKPLDLQHWGDSNVGFSIDFPLLLDPGFKLGSFFTSDATPLNMLVDARSMKVIDITMGWSPDYWQQVTKLLDRL